MLGGWCQVMDSIRMCQKFFSVISILKNNMANKMGSLKKFKFDWFQCKRGVLFPRHFLEKGSNLHAKTNMCTHFSYKSHHQHPPLVSISSEFCKPSGKPAAIKHVLTLLYICKMLQLLVVGSIISCYIKHQKGVINDLIYLNNLKQYWTGSNIQFKLYT